MKKPFRGKFLSLTVEKNAIDYLEKAGMFIDQAMTNEIAWKWVVMSLHGALYGFAIAACKSTDYQSVVKNTRKGGEQLITLDEALKMCKDDKWMGTLIGGLPLNLSVNQERSIRLLKKTLRNRFEHHIPCCWQIELHGLPKISIDILDVIHFLAIETFRYQHLDQMQREKIKLIIYQSKRLLQESPMLKEQ